ncbi:hypothetical protein LNKW23_34730 [Paralimibaculum aggregatum]|uniref:Uncharacterized protein n=1 Tax=Paralimibaculum aggregatum TaxID=3036245 RepID=A0ABQ6LM41_9RHOB|nr:hypothetical protein [Limibaculum sp. NKW23]GMG84258.1 hypothetical protein LNKW23_34730 [Limibaculum sp. NKW23]
MGLADAIATLPDWVRLWVLWLNIATLGSFAVLALRRATWIEAAAILLANLAMVPVMRWLYAELGFVRLLGLPHLLFWTPLAIFLLLRLGRGVPGPQRQVLWIYLASIGLSLAFDAADVIRYILGERASMIPPTG